MIHSIRTNIKDNTTRNKSILESMVCLDYSTPRTATNKYYDFKNNINIKNYTDFLLSLINEKRQDFLNDMIKYQNLREEYYSKSANSINTGPEKINNFLKEKFETISKKWGLEYVTD